MLVADVQENKWEHTRAPEASTWNWHMVTSSIFHWPNLVRGQSRFKGLRNQFHLLLERAAKWLWKRIQGSMGHWGCFCNWSTREAVTSNSVMTPLYLLLSAPSGWYFLQMPNGGRVLTFFREGISNCKVALQKVLPMSTPTNFQGR